MVSTAQIYRSSVLASPEFVRSHLRFALESLSPHVRCNGESGNLGSSVRKCTAVLRTDSTCVPNESQNPKDNSLFARNPAALLLSGLIQRHVLRRGEFAEPRSWIPSACRAARGARSLLQHLVHGGPSDRRPNAPLDGNPATVIRARAHRWNELPLFGCGDPRTAI